MFGEDTLFEKQMRDFEAIEADENKNVDEQVADVDEQEESKTDELDKVKEQQQPSTGEMWDRFEELKGYSQPDLVKFSKLSELATLSDEEWANASREDLINDIMSYEFGDLWDEVGEEEKQSAKESKGAEVDEKKKPPVCKKCDKAHWPFKKCSAKESEEQGEVTDEKVEEQDIAGASIGFSVQMDIIPDPDLDIDEDTVEGYLADLLEDGKLEIREMHVRTLYESKTDEQDKVKEDTKGFLPRQELQQLIDAWELISQHDDDPRVRIMADEKAKELEDLIDAAQTGEQREVTDEKVEEQLVPRSDDLLFIEKSAFKDTWELFRTREGSRSATQVYTFVSEEAAAAAGQKIADAIGGEFRGKEDPRDPEGRQRTESTSKEKVEGARLTESTVFEDHIKDFEAIEVDPNKNVDVKEEKVNEQGGEMVGPIEIGPDEFDIVANTLAELGSIDPELAMAEGQGNVTIVITDGKRFIGVDPQGYDYARYKTSVFDSVEEVMDAAADDEGWSRKHTVGV